MEAAVNALIGIGLLLILILVIYLIDKVNTIEKETRQVMVSITDKAVRAEDPFKGLSSKALWDTMSGSGRADLDANAMLELRNLYQLVLSKHMEALYQEGFKDGLRGMAGEPKNTKQISTSKGVVESWIPAPQANALYECGLNASQIPEPEWGPIRQSMDEAGLFLLTKTQLDATSLLSEWLMPAPALPVNETAPSAAGALSDLSGMSTTRPNTAGSQPF